MSRKPESVVVVGGGVVGLSCAYFLARRGVKVTVLERRRAEAPNCSTGNAGLVVPSHIIPLASPGVIGQGLRWMLDPGSPFSVRMRPSWGLWQWAWRFHRSCSRENVERAKPVLRDLSLESRRLYRELANEEGWSFGLEERGLLNVWHDEETGRHELALARQAEEMGLDVEVLDSSQVASLEPHIQFDVAGGVYFPQDCHLVPAVFRKELIAAVTALGGDVVWECEATSFIRRGRQVERVVTSQGDFRADEVLLAGGTWTSGLARQLGRFLPMQPGKGCSMTLEKPPAKPHLSVLLVDARIAVTPMGEALRFGGTMEIGGAEGVVNRRKVAGMAKAIPTYFPEFAGYDFMEEPVWTGLRPCSPDGLPYLGRLRGYENLSVATGHAMLGLSLGPVSGLLLSQVLMDEEPCVAMKHLAPDRFER